MWGYTTTLRKTEEMSEGGARETEERRTEEANTRGGCISLLSLIIVDTTKNPVNV